MIKKFFCVMFSVILIFTLTACNSKKDNIILENNTPNDIIVDTPNNDNDDKVESDIEQDEETIIQPETPNAPTIPAPPNQDVFEDNIKLVDVLLKSKLNGLNIRSLPSTSSMILGTINKNDAVAFYGEVGDFYQTVYKNKKAYVHKNYVTFFEFEKSNNNKIEDVIENGKSLLGFPYVYGAQRYHFSGNLNKNFVFGQFDCSSLTQYLFYFNGINLKPTSREQSLQGETVTKNNLQRGDLMYFTNSTRKNYSGIEKIGHVAIYIGQNYILHTASDYAVIEEISSTRWSYFISAKRVLF